MQTVLTIAGFDPSSGAGISADLAVFAAHGLFGTSAITALTVQSTMGVRSVHPIAPEVLGDMLDALEDDLPAAGIKIGMLGSAACVDTVAQFIQRLRRNGRTPPIVLDPVIRSSSGEALLESEGIDILRTSLLPLIDFATPNVTELCVLAGLDRLQGLTAITEAAREFQTTNPRLCLLVTGGDLEPPDDLLLPPLNEQRSTNPVWLPGQRVHTTSTHGTGCAFSSAFLSRLVLGDDTEAAAKAAKLFVAGAMQAAKPLGRGRGPVDLFWSHKGD